jgi:DNA (cytosine-5)-methyltransferase 1
MEKGRKMKVFSMFSGIGGFEKGILDIDPGSEIVGHSEIDKYADYVYSKHFPESKNFGDATKIKTKDLPDIDCIVGGFPCQSFSIAGKRGGINYDTRGTLFREIIRIAKDKKPGIIFLENVRGLLSSNKGWDFYVIADSLAQCGYIVEWQIFNTKDFLPQNRERVFIVGYLAERCKQKIFPIYKNDKIHNECKIPGRQRPLDEQEKSNINNAKKPGKCSNSRTKIADYRMDEGLRIRQDNNSPTLNADCHRDHNTNKHLSKCPPLVIQPVLTPNRKEKRQNGRRLKNHNDPMFSLTAQDQHGVKINTKIRRLNPIECERLQGFPDNWTAKGIKDGKEIEISDTQRYKQCGNSVSTPVISFIWKRIKECIK